MRFLHFNTGRAYGPAGQPIYAMVEADPLAMTGHSMWFMDETRMIVGKMESVRPEAGSITLMDRYDLGLYESVSSLDPMIALIRQQFKLGDAA
jgi:hypothetical protein